jgi:hypothetical protein
VARPGSIVWFLLSEEGKMFTLLLVVLCTLWLGSMYLAFGWMGVTYALIISLAFFIVTVLIFAIRKRKGYPAFPANDNYRPPS